MGETLDSILNQYGDFHEYIINKAKLNKSEVIVINCKKEEEPPNLENIKGTIITGSHSMVPDYESWSVKISQWLKKVVETNILVLGICYGHQILAYNDNDSTQSFSYKNHI